jgi:transcriptional regulator with XRE-family HTH domain
MVFGKNLRRLRKAQGLTQEQLGAKVGIWFTHVSQIEHGRNPNVELANDIAAALGTTLDEMMRDPDGEPEQVQA